MGADVPRVIDVPGDIPNKENKYRLFVFTRFGDDRQDFQPDDSMKYLAYGHEVCPTTGRKHLQGFVYFKNGRTEAAVCKKYGMYMRHMRGNLDQNDYYCSKQSELIEFGNRPSQGARTDLDILAKQIMKGEKNVVNVMIDEPTTYHFYKRTLGDMEDFRNRKKFRTEMTKGIWIYGETGTGKSTWAFKDFHPDTHYRWVNDGGWWDAYCGQQTVIIDEFRGNIPFNEMLQLVDRWPYMVRRRGREPYPFTSETVIVTSYGAPEEIYGNMGEDSIAQLHRRFQVVHIKDIDELI